MTDNDGHQVPLEPAFRIEPANPNVTAGGSLQFRALSKGGTELLVRWRLENPDFGSVTGTGLFTSCWAAGATQLTALLQADSTQQATTQITLAQPAVALVQVTSLSYATNGAPARIDSIAGGIDASIGVSAALMVCREVTSVRLELVGASSVTLLGEAIFSPALTTNTTVTFRWTTTGVAPGTYGLRAAITVRDRGDITSPAQSIQIRN